MGDPQSLFDVLSLISIHYSPQSLAMSNFNKIVLWGFMPSWIFDIEEFKTWFEAV